FAYDAVVVGSGPNGLAAAIRLAQEGCSVLVLEANETVGGSTRSSELTLPGFVHDLCSAVHPLALGSPFFRQLPLEKYGLHWIQTPIALAHPLPDNVRGAGVSTSVAPAALLSRDLNQTAQNFGVDGKSYERLFSPLTENWRAL